MTIKDNIAFCSLYYNKKILKHHLKEFILIKKMAFCEIFILDYINVSCNRLCLQHWMFWNLPI